MKKNILLLTIALLAGNVCMAENDNNKRTLTQKKYPVGYDNTSFAVFYFNGKNAYNNRGMVIFSGPRHDSRHYRGNYLLPRRLYGFETRGHHGNIKGEHVKEET